MKNMISYVLFLLVVAGPVVAIPCDANKKDPPDCMLVPINSGIGSCAPCSDKNKSNYRLASANEAKAAMEKAQKEPMCQQPPQLVNGLPPMCDVAPTCVAGVCQIKNLNTQEIQKRDNQVRERMKQNQGQGQR